VNTDTLRDAITALSHALDPDHQGDCWPDPIAWDGRPLMEQAKDLLALAAAHVADEYSDVAATVAVLREAMDAERHDALIAAARRLHGSEAPVLARRGAELVGLVYHADEDCRWHAMTLDACRALVATTPDEYQGDILGQAYTASDGYTAWCENYKPVGEGPTANGALLVAGWARADVEEYAHR